MTVRAGVFAGFLAVVSVAGTARASDAPAPPVRIWLEARPWTCVSHVPPLAREVTLACDAAGGVCAVATSEAEADRRLVLRCDGDGAWSVEGTDAAGARRWAADLSGTVDERLRTASVWVVRAETAATEAPPPRTPPPAAPAAAREEPPTKEKPAPGPTGPSPRGSTLAVSAVGTLGWTKTADQGTAVGAGAMWGGRLVPEINLGLALGIEHVVEGEGAVPRRPPTNEHAGLVAGWGAPFDASHYGFLFEGGAGYQQSSTADGAYGYGRAALTAQLAPREAVRPWAAFSFTQRSMDSHLNLTRIFSLDLGVAWSP